MLGTILWYNKFRGFGMVSTDDNKSAFIHFSNIRDENKTLKENERVEFEVSKGIKGDCAIDLKRIS